MNTKVECALIIEPGLDGHRATYLKKICEIIGNKNVIIGTSYSVSDEDLYKKCGACGVVDIIRFEVKNKKILGLPGSHALGYWRHAREVYKAAIKKHKVSYVLIPFGDNFLNLIPVVGSPFGESVYHVICMRQDFHHVNFGIVGARSNLFNLIKRVLFEAALKSKNLGFIFSIDELLVDFYKNNNRASERLVYFPDPVDEISISPDAICKKKYLLVYGAINSRKGVLELVSSFIRVSDGLNFCLVIAGKIADDIIDALNNIHGKELNKKIVIINKYLTDDEESNLIYNAFAIWLGYKNHQMMSGVLVKAARAKKPIIACSNGLIGFYAKKYNLGPIIDISVDASIDSALNNIDGWVHRCREDVFLENTWEQAGEILCSKIIQKN